MHINMPPVWKDVSRLVVDNFCVSLFNMSGFNTLIIRIYDHSAWLGCAPHYPGSSDLEAQSASITWMSSEVSVFFPLPSPFLSDRLPSCAQFQPWNIRSESSSENEGGRAPWRHPYVLETPVFQTLLSLVMTGYLVEECMISEFGTSPSICTLFPIIIRIYSSDIPQYGFGSIAYLQIPCINSPQLGTLWAAHAHKT